MNTTPSMEPVIAQTLDRSYGIKASQIRLLGNFWNTTYRIDSVTGESFVLRVSAPAVTGPGPIENEINWLNYVATSSDLLVPQAIRTADGTYTTQIRAGDSTRPCCLFRWIEGKPVDTEWPQDALKQIGHIAGTLHRLSQGYAPPPAMARPNRIHHSDDPELARVRDPAWIDWLKARASASDHDIRMLLTAIKMVTSELGAPVDEGWNAGLVHGDLHPGNFLVTPAGISIIDFDQLGWGLFEVELAWLVSTTVDVCPVPEHGRREVLLSAYEDTTRLPFRSGQELDVRIAFFHLLHFEWISGLSDPTVIGRHMDTMGARLDALRDFVRGQSDE